MTKYLEIKFTISPVEGRDIVLAFLDQAGYDSFQETEDGLLAYIARDDYSEDELTEILAPLQEGYSITYQSGELETKNWNKEWETNYDPIEIDKQLYVRASFHEPKPEYPLEIIITPKMSFGTGHHQTTRLMSRLLLEMDLKSKKLLDMGTGTGLLAILAEKRGAGPIDAIDIFEWAVENSAENVEVNQCHQIKTHLGDASLLKDRQYDVVVANINRNVLLEDIKTYCETLSSGGQLLLSGFFASDVELIDDEATKYGAKLVKSKEEAPWVARRYEIA